MDFYKYSIEDAGTFSSFTATLENAGAIVEGSNVMFESDNSAAKMLADTLVEYDIIAPMMEAGQAPAQEQPAVNNQQKQQAKQARKPSAQKPTATDKGTAGGVDGVVAGEKNSGNLNDKGEQIKRDADPAPTQGQPSGNTQPNATRGAGGNKSGNGAMGDVAAKAKEYISNEMGIHSEKVKGMVAGLVKQYLEKYANRTDIIKNFMENPNALKASINRWVSKNNDINSAVGAEKKRTENNIKSSQNETDASEMADTVVKKLGITDERIKADLVKKYNDENARARAKGNKNRELADVVEVLKRFPDVFDEVKDSGAFEKMGYEVTDDGLIKKKSNSGARSENGIGAIGIPEAFTVEPDESEWENAVITSFGFPMVNLSSPLVRDMLRATDPKQQKRSYRELTKQMKKQPAIANALGMGVLGTLGLRNSGQKSKSTTVKLDSVNGGANPVMEGPVTVAKDIISGRASMTPVDILKLVANQKGTPCKRNPLYVRAEQLEGKGDDDNVKVVPIGNGLKKKNQELEVPLKHLTTFYTVIDPKQSFGAYVKAYAELAMKNKNIAFWSGLRSESAKEKQVKAGMADAEKHLKEYVKKNGTMPFYLLKARSQPKEIDRWSDEDALHGYQLVVMNVDGHKAGMFLTKDTAEALFKVG